MKRVFTIFLVAILAVSVAGCGSSSNNDPSIKYSSDYYGLEKGFELIYSVIETENETTSNHTLTKLVTGETTTGSGIYKVTEAYENETLGDEGEYIQKKDPSYFQYGDWEGATVHWESTPQLILTNPVTKSFKSPWLEETVMGQETVSVPAGTFNAWLFQEIYESSNPDWGTYTRVWKEWFVPNLGFVKMMMTATRKSDGVTLSTATSELKSSATGVTINNNNLKSSQIVTQSITTGNVHPKLFHSKH